MRIITKLLVALGGFLLAQQLMISSASANVDRMEFRLDDSDGSDFKRITFKGGNYEIYAAGPIDEDVAIRFKNFVSVHKIDHAIIYFDSPGGSLKGGLNLGHAIRSLGFETGVRSINYEYGKGPVAICASACAYAFAGGAARFYDDKVGRLGLHQFYGSEDLPISSEDSQFTLGFLIDYLDEMGIPGKTVALASRAKKSEMIWLSTEDAEGIQLANNGVQPTKAEIKLSGGHPYLRLQQDFSDVTSRVLIYCDGDAIIVLGGIVTNPEFSNRQSGVFTISYLEFGTQEYQKIPESRGFEAEGSTIWVERRIPRSQIELLTKSDYMGIWLENGGPLRWGTFLNLRQVRPHVTNFLENCKSS